MVEDIHERHDVEEDRILSSCCEQVDVPGSICLNHQLGQIKRIILIPLSALKHRPTAEFLQTLSSLSKDQNELGSDPLE